MLSLTYSVANKSIDVSCLSVLPAMENLTPVTLVVKAPSQKIGDQTIECALDWTVKKLKEHLSSVYPSKPVSSTILFLID